VSLFAVSGDFLAATNGSIYFHTLRSVVDLSVRGVLSQVSEISCGFIWLYIR
jgi:hypothetical protein